MAKLRSSGADPNTATPVAATRIDFLIGTSSSAASSIQGGRGQLRSWKEVPPLSPHEQVRKKRRGRKCCKPRRCGARVRTIRLWRSGLPWPGIRLPRISRRLPWRCVPGTGGRRAGRVRPGLRPRPKIGSVCFHRRVIAVAQASSSKAPDGKQVGRAGEQHVPGGPPMHLGHGDRN